MNMLENLWTRCITGVWPRFSDRFDQTIRRLGGRGSTHERDDQRRQLPPDPNLFWEAMTMSSTTTGELELVDLARELRNRYPGLRSPRAWRDTFRWWRAQETHPWRQAVLSELGNSPTFNILFSSVEELSRADGLQVEGPENLSQVRDRFPDEMEIDQYW